MRRLALVAAALLLVACGGHEAADDQGLHQDIQSNSNGAEVTFDATILTDPIESGGHERFEVKADMEFAPQEVATYKARDGLVIHGQLYIDPGPRYGVHCTHAHTSSGCPNPGWIEYNNSYYE